MKNSRGRQIPPKVEFVRIGGRSVHKLPSTIPLGDRLCNYADIVDAGLTKSVDHRGKNSKRNSFIAAKINGVLLLAKLGLHFGPKLVNIDRIAAQINQLRFV